MTKIALLSNSCGKNGTLSIMSINIGAKAKELRTEKGLTQQQMADLLGIKYRESYSKYELGKLEFNNEMLVTLADYFDVTTDYLLGRED